MRRLGLAVVVVLLLALVVEAHDYLLGRLVFDLALPPPWTAGLVALVVVLGACLVLEPAASRFADRRAARLVAWPAFLWMGLVFYLLVLLFLSDAALALAGRTPRGPSGARARAAAVAALATVAAATGVRGALRGPAHRRVEIPLARWPAGLDGFRIVQVSDVHLGPLLGRSFSERIVALVEGLRPDVVAVTGDLVDGGVLRLAAEAAPLAALRAPHGVFFVTGNHDYFSGADPWIAEVRRLGMRVLRNERVTIGANGATFDLAGVDDRHARFFGGDHGEDVPRALAGRDPARPVVLLAHDPGTFREAARLGVDLQLSGHTHGGQIWPFGYLVRLFVPWVAGRYAARDAQLYVSRGTGFWGPPMRLFAPAEVTELVLRAPA